VLYAQTEGVEVIGTPASPGAGPFMMDLHRPRIVGSVKPAAHHTAERCHPAEVALLFVSQIDSDPV